MFGRTWPQIGVGLAFVFLLGLGVMLAMRLAKIRPPVAR